jgi:gluconate kinase
MFIVVEGTDASGKTSLISAVENEVKRRYPDRKITMSHKGRPLEETRRWVLNEYVTSCEDINFTDETIVSDRWHWGEITYAPLKRAHTNLDGYGLLAKSGWRWTELFLLSRGAAEFWLYQPLEIVKSRLESRGDDFVKVNELESILEQYEVASILSPALTEILKPKPNSLDKVEELARYVVDQAEKKLNEARYIRRYKNYIGSPNPDVLLIGDRRNIVERYGEETQLPFMPVDGNSGEFLLSALPDKFWKNVGIVNANDIEFNLHDLWLDLNRPRIVVLGRLAEKAVVRTEINPKHYDVLPHPQYVRRFHNKDKEIYGQAIEKSAYNNLEKDSPWILR